jgi:hypothetical protein
MFAAAVTSEYCEIQADEGFKDLLRAFFIIISSPQQNLDGCIHL